MLCHIENGCKVTSFLCPAAKMMWKNDAALNWLSSSLTVSLRKTQLSMITATAKFSDLPICSIKTWIKSEKTGLENTAIKMWPF